jgi:hypothetical protein
MVTPSRTDLNGASPPDVPNGIRRRGGVPQGRHLQIRAGADWLKAYL